MGNMHSRIYMRLPVHLYLRGEMRSMKRKYCLQAASSLVDTRGFLASGRFELFEFARRYHSPPSKVVTSTSVPVKLELLQRVRSKGMGIMKAQNQL